MYFVLLVTICVPEIYSKECDEMKKDSAVKGIPVSCISGRDRYECIEKVGKKEADVVAVDPEDMYLAVKDNKLASNAGYNVIEQVIFSLSSSFLLYNTFLKFIKLFLKKR